jgi:hypothetical protein
MLYVAIGLIWTIPRESQKGLKCVVISYWVVLCGFFLSCFVSHHCRPLKLLTFSARANYIDCYSFGMPKERLQKPAATNREYISITRSGRSHKQNTSEGECIKMNWLRDNVAIWKVIIMSRKYLRGWAAVQIKFLQLFDITYFL